jgi:hypothetical protein
MLDTTVIASGGAPNGIQGSKLTIPPLWHSTEGGAWTPASIDDPASGWAASLITAGPGVVAVGWEGCDGPWPYRDLRACTAAIWSSADGATWNRVDEHRFAGSILAAIVAWQGGLLAVGAQQQAAAGVNAREPLVLRSNDGRAWEQVEVAGDVAGATFTVLAADEDRLVVLGFRASPDEPGLPYGRTTAWTSTDASTWSTEGLLAEQQPIPMSLSPTASGFVATGYSWGTMRSFTWRHIAGGWIDAGLGPDVATGGLRVAGSGPPGSLCVGGQTGNGAMLLYGSVDGTEWTPIAATGELATSLVPLSLSWRTDRFLLAGARATADGTNQGIVLSGLPTVAAAAP